jgi:hypothetical protein
VTLVFGPRAVIAEEGFDALGEVGELLTVDVDDERWCLRSLLSMTSESSLNSSECQ